MVAGNLDTTNLLLGIMAAVSVLQALLLIAAGVMGWRLYARALQTVRDIEDRQVAPLVARVSWVSCTPHAISWGLFSTAGGTRARRRDTCDRGGSADGGQLRTL